MQGAMMRYHIRVTSVYGVLGFARCLVLSLAVLLTVSIVLARPAMAQGEQSNIGNQSPAASIDGALSENPLMPLPMATPQQTLKSFLSLSNAGEDALLEAFAIAADNSSVFDTPEVRQLKQGAVEQIVKAASTLDLSSVAPENRRTLGINSVLLLKEVLERISLPPLDTDATAQASGDGTKALAYYILPGTDITIVNKPTANGNSHFVFSENTIERLPEFYDLVKALPQKTGSSVDFYRFFVLGPGLDLPVELYRHVMDLPSWALAEIAGQAVWQWIAFGVMTLLVSGLIAVLVRATHWRAMESAGRGSILLPFVIAIVLWGYGAVCNDLVNLTGSVEAMLELVVVCLQALALAVGVVITSNAIGHMVVSWRIAKLRSLNASLILLGIRLAGFILGGCILVLAASRLGLPLYGILASLGVGGLALALAVRPTLENFIGGVILYADKPVQVGDLCKFGAIKGTVETIGLRSTRIRAEDHTLVTVQNSDFAEMSIINFSRRNSDLFTSEFNFPAGVDPTRMLDILGEISNYMKSLEPVVAESVQVYLSGVQNNALKFEVRAYIRTRNETQFFKVREELLLGIVTMLKQHETASA